MIRRPPRSTRTDTLFPDTTLFRSCPSMLDTVASQMLKVDHPSPFMTFTFEVNEGWKERVGEVVHEDRSEEHTSELQSLMRTSYAVFCLKKKSNNKQHTLTSHVTPSTLRITSTHRHRRTQCHD